MNTGAAQGPAAMHRLRVQAMTWEADGVLGIALVPATPGAGLPPAEPGAHIVLRLGNGLCRSYSLTNPGDGQRWCIAVHRSADSRGGSRWVHTVLRPGDPVEAEGPHNHFALDAGAPMSVLVAGGIGITPLLAMARQLAAQHRPWALHYAARTQAQMAFADELRALAAPTGATLDLRCDHEGDRPLDLPAIVAALPAGAHVYACGPAGLLDAFEAATAALPPARVHLERFAGTQDAATAAGCTVTLARSGRRLAVAPGQSILDALIAIGAEPPYSCREGLCGTCETRVLRGTPDHRDRVLGAAARAAGDRMMVCCSGALTPELELDL